MPDWTGIAIHHSATEDDTEHEDTEAIERFHEGDRGWSDIGYNGLVESVEGFYEYRNGRGTDTVGAHVKGHNGYLLGLCFVGNYNRSAPNEEILETGANVLFNWMANYGIKLNRVQGHRDWADKDTDCPGTEFDLTRLRDKLCERWYSYLANNQDWSVEQQQRAINLVGIDAGPIDGIMGEQTKRGIKKANLELLNVNRNQFTQGLRRAILSEIKKTYEEG